MKLKSLTAASLAAFICQTPVLADGSDSVEITGLIEVEAGHAEPYEGDSEMDVILATVELGVAAQITDWVRGEVLFLFEEGDNDNVTDIDIGTLTIAPPDGSWFIAGGRMYLPFGVYETTMISDPLTLELGETRETALMFGVEGKNLYGAAFLYNGDNGKDDDNRIDHFGAVIGYAMESNGVEFGWDLAYIDDTGDTDALQDAVAGNLEAAGEARGETGPETYDDHVSGFAASGRLRQGDVAFMAEYLGAAERFQSIALAYGGSVVEGAYANRGARPSSWMVEAAYDFMIRSQPATIAVGYQGTDDAVGVELPESRFMIGGSVELMDSVALGVEWAHDKDYDTDEWSDCVLADVETVECAFAGTDENADTVTVQLAAEF
ncbi:MAG: LbtU family siderophore porin [Gammaproteobacteria bacterium]|nr:LbtU family siderophore porin [Gammaproteobacteria bacterium]